MANVKMNKAKDKITGSRKLAEWAVCTAEAQNIDDRDDILNLIIEASITSEKDGKIEVSANDLYMAVHAAYKLGKYFSKKDEADHLNKELKSWFVFN